MSLYVTGAADATTVADVDTSETEGSHDHEALSAPERVHLLSGSKRSRCEAADEVRTIPSFRSAFSNQRIQSYLREEDGDVASRGLQFLEHKYTRTPPHTELSGILHRCMY